MFVYQINATGILRALVECFVLALVNSPEGNTIMPWEGGQQISKSGGAFTSIRVGPRFNAGAVAVAVTLKYYQLKNLTLCFAL